MSILIYNKNENFIQKDFYDHFLKEKFNYLNKKTIDYFNSLKDHKKNSRFIKDTIISIFSKSKEILKFLSVYKDATRNDKDAIKNYDKFENFCKKFVSSFNFDLDPFFYMNENQEPKPNLSVLNKKAISFLGLAKDVNFFEKEKIYQIEENFIKDGVIYNPNFNKLKNKELSILIISRERYEQLKGLAPYYRKKELKKLSLETLLKYQYLVDPNKEGILFSEPNFYRAFQALTAKKTFVLYVTSNLMTTLAVLKEKREKYDLCFRDLWIRAHGDPWSLSGLAFENPDCDAIKNFSKSIFSLLYRKQDKRVHDVVLLCCKTGQHLAAEISYHLETTRKAKAPSASSFRVHAPIDWIVLNSFKILNHSPLFLYGSRSKELDLNEENIMVVYHNGHHELLSKLAPGSKEKLDLKLFAKEINDVLNYFKKYKQWGGINRFIKNLSKLDGLHLLQDKDLKLILEDIKGFDCSVEPILSTLLSKETHKHFLNNKYITSLCKEILPSSYINYSLKNKLITADNARNLLMSIKNTNDLATTLKKIITLSGCDKIIFDFTDILKTTLLSNKINKSRRWSLLQTALNNGYLTTFEEVGLLKEVRLLLSSNQQNKLDKLITKKKRSQIGGLLKI